MASKILKLEWQIEVTSDKFFTQAHKDLCTKVGCLCKESDDKMFSYIWYEFKQASNCIIGNFVSDGIAVKLQALSLQGAEPSEERS